MWSFAPSRTITVYERFQLLISYMSFISVNLRPGIFGTLHWSRYWLSYDKCCSILRRTLDVIQTNWTNDYYVFLFAHPSIRLRFTASDYPRYLHTFVFVIVRERFADFQFTNNHWQTSLLWYIMFHIIITYICVQ
jgi:hypothetical protein